MKKVRALIQRKPMDKPTDPNAPITHAITALSDEGLQAVAEALVNRVAGMIGTHQVRVEEAQGALFNALQDIRYQLAQTNARSEAEANDRGVVVEYLKRQSTQMEALSAGQQLLRDEFSTVAENVSDLTATVARHETIIQDFYQSRADSIRERKELRENQETMAATLARIEEAILKPEERVRLRRLLDQADE